MSQVIPHHSKKLNRNFAFSLLILHRMSVSIIGAMLFLVLIYFVIGFVFALLFSFRWVDKLDEGAQRAPLGFRLLLIPGSTLLWIFLYSKLRKQKQG